MWLCSLKLYDYKICYIDIRTNYVFYQIQLEESIVLQ